MRMLSDSPAAADASMAPLLVSPAAAGGGLLPPAGQGSASFDANMVLLVLAALLCVLVFGLCLNSFIRLALHCDRRGALTEAAPPAATVAVPVPASDGGLKRMALRRIPVVVYEANKAGAPGTECAICLGEFAGGVKVRLLPRCRHGFHVRCIDTWLSTHSSCPMCRNSLLEEGEPGEATVAGA